MERKKRKPKKQAPKPVRVKRERREKFVPIEDEDFPTRLTPEDLQRLL